MNYILAIDQGTSSTKTIVFDENGQAVAKGSVDLKTNYSGNGFVEQVPEDIFQNVLESVRECIDNFSTGGFDLSDIVSCGISNQRETFVLWDEKGEPLSPAVVWACKRSIRICEELRSIGQEELIRQSTGLIIDPYFSGTKLLWLIQHDPALREKLEKGEVFFGTVDTWLLFRLTGGKQFRTDYTNASRTLLFNIHTLSWDKEILELWGIEKLHLPEVCPSSFDFGKSDFQGIFSHEMPVTAMIGDSHAATFGEGCFEKGNAKVTLGTGSSIMMNTGEKPVASANGMLTTICWSTGSQVNYALEGAIVSCGSTIEWLKNELNLFTDPKETEQMAGAVEDNGGVYLVPAFSGLGAPHWQMSRKASIEGLTFGATKNHIVRAALESIPYQIRDVTEAMKQDIGSPLRAISVNGGMTQNRFVIRFLADLLGLELRKLQTPDVSALGAAYLSGLQSGVFKSLSQLSEINGSHTETILPDSDNKAILTFYEGWKEKIRG
ncbi:glycerol kinase GlpK [Emticicia sp. CRIBPO]|uniref:FGGY family carbohydrate kinase n=1 Tax=Emticicia sp. CRIBPO TaxID=2683258 RepID=UPI001412A68B|nr:glycerol kinase GlpK [Emticicia sp. CRIBPO]NBA85211.1 glycerol kinase GlpK [Emticicia sp. CRIBPO]